MHGLQGFTAANKYRAQWIFFTPPGYRDEFFVVPFELVVLANGVLQKGYPVQLDDDAPFIARAIMVPEVGAAGLTPALMQLIDCYGNAIQIEPCLAGGMGGEVSGVASGFPLDAPLFCPASGVLTWNVAASNNGVQAQLFYSNGGGGLVVFTMVAGGTAGNAYTMRFLDPGAPGSPLTVSLVGTVITANLATDGGGVITSTIAQVVAALAADGAIAAVVTGSIESGGAELATAFGPTSFDSGADASNITIRGEFRGVKRFKAC